MKCADAGSKVSKIHEFEYERRAFAVEQLRYRLGRVVVLEEASLRARQ